MAAVVPENIDPALLARVGSIRRPTGDLPLDADLSHLPGKSGLWTGLNYLRGMKTRGVEHQLEVGARHGKVFRYQLANIPIVAVFGSEEVGEVGRNSEGIYSTSLGWRYFFGAIDEASSTFDSPTGVDFEPHREVRKIFQPGFSGEALSSYTDIAAAGFAREIDGWVERGGVHFKPSVRRLMANVANRIFIGREDAESAALFDGGMANLWESTTALVQHDLLSPRWRRGRKSWAAMFRRLRDDVDEQRSSQRDNLYSLMLRAEDKADWLDDDTLVRLFLNLMAAAFDTTSHGTVSMAYLLAKHPEWQERLRDEALGLGREPLRYDQVKQLPMHDWVWKETLRLLPVANALPRRALRETHLGGHRIPAGAFVWAHLGPPMRDPARWTEPARFDPERFAPERAEDRKQGGGYMPFGSGPHACIGARLSTIEAVTFWHTLLTRCRIRLAKPYEGHHQYGPLGVVSGGVDLVLERL